MKFTSVYGYVAGILQSIFLLLFLKLREIMKEKNGSFFLSFFFFLSSRSVSFVLDVNYYYSFLVRSSTRCWKMWRINQIELHGRKCAERRTSDEEN